MSVMNAVHARSWQPTFRHSAGLRGSHFIRAIRDRKELLGWKTERLGVTVPPIESGTEGEWVKVGPGATLLGYAPSKAQVADGQVADSNEAGTVFAAIKLDGADTMLYVRVVCANTENLSSGMRLEAVFAEVPDAEHTLPVFQPVGAVQ